MYSGFAGAIMRSEMRTRFVVLIEGKGSGWRFMNFFDSLFFPVFKLANNSAIFNYYNRARHWHGIRWGLFKAFQSGSNK